MHSDTEVCRLYKNENTVEVVNERLLPFALRSGDVTVADFMEWLSLRTNNISRTYMNMVYSVRKVLGRDPDAVINDSCAISIIDKYWVRRTAAWSDIKNGKWSDLKEVRWGDLQRKRDVDLALVNTALSGQYTAEAFKKAVDDTTSLFTIKGAFPKAIHDGYILKKGCNAEYEAAAYSIGNTLGIAVAEAFRRDDGIIACKLFTSETVSLAHASEFRKLLKLALDNVHEEIYQFFVSRERVDIVHQLEQLYIFNYLVVNTDFHDENFGFLYDSNSFEILSAAPAYDFNSAFMALDDVTAYYEWIVRQLPLFMHKHPDIKKRLDNTEFLSTLDSLPDLTPEQKRCVRMRAEFLCNMRNDR
jgi:hypothetical protein